MSNAKDNIRQFATWAPAFSPLLLLFVFLSLALHVRVGLGHWPEPMVENYRSEAYFWHEKILDWVIYGTIFLAPIVWGLLLIFRRFRMGVRAHLSQAAVYLLGWALIVTYSLIDPGRFMEWYLD